MTSRPPIHPDNIDKPMDRYEYAQRREEYERWEAEERHEYIKRQKEKAEKSPFKDGTYSY